MKTVLILFDSLNCGYMESYNPQAWVKTPNLKRFAERSLQFENHFIGSMPCMPARRDIMTGRLGFLERGWGGLEPFDVTLPGLLRERGGFTHMATDHYHYLELGGEGYLQVCDTWECFRGAENDPWVSVVGQSGTRKGSHPDRYGKYNAQYELNKERFAAEADWPGPQTFQSACDWVERNRDADNVLLWVETFDPHEPFDAPREFLELYGDAYEGKEFNWSAYAPVIDEPPEALERLQKWYAANLTMIDKWFGRFIETLERSGWLDDTLVIVTTDHGHFLGEHGYTGKNQIPCYDCFANIPLLVHLPGGARGGERIGALTQNIDILPTLLDVSGFPAPDGVHGVSWRPLLEGRATEVHESVIYGYFGMQVNITDGRHTYMRGSVTEANEPLYEYKATPTGFRRLISRPPVGAGPFLRHTSYPVFRWPASGRRQWADQTMLFDRQRDPEQLTPLVDSAVEARMADLLRQALAAHDSPDEQRVRLGLGPDRT